MKYWNEQGRYQQEYNAYWKALVPNTGEAATTEGEALRAISRIYYDIYNNGGCNILESEEVYDDDGNYECDEHSISSFYDSFFDAVARFTGDHDNVRLLKMKVEDLGVDYWHKDLGAMLDSLIDKTIEKIGTEKNDMCKE
jgi:hypothetical protein